MNNPEYIILEIEKFLKLDPAKALKLIFDKDYGKLVYFATSMIEDRCTAEDIANDTFLKFWKIIHNFDTYANVKAFLYLVARNGCINYLRHLEIVDEYKESVLRQPNMTNDENIEEMIDNKLMGSEVVKSSSGLPRQRKIILEMIFLKNLSTPEIAKELGLALSTIRVQKRIIKMWISKILKERGFLSLVVIFFRFLARYFSQ